MAAPTYRAAGVKSDAGIGAVAVAAPAGIATGDLEMMTATTIDTATISITADGGGSWTGVTGTPITVTNGQNLYVWYRIRAGGDSDPSVQASANHVCSCRFCWQAGTFDTSDPLEIEATGTEATSDTSFSWAPGTTTTGVDRHVICIASIRNDSATGGVAIMTNATLSSLVLIANHSTTQGLGGGYGATYGVLAAAGGVGTFTRTYSAASPKSYVSFAVKPVPAAPSKNLAALGVG